MPSSVVEVSATAAMEPGRLTRAHARSRWAATHRAALSWAAVGLLAAACEAPRELPALPAAVPADAVQEQGRSEVQRLVADERARLLIVEQEQVHWGAELERRRQLTRERRDATLGWQRRIRESKAASEADSSHLDALYDDCLRALLGAHAELRRALALPVAPVVPRAGANLLSGLEAEAGTEEVRGVRARLEAEAQRLEVLAKETGSEERAQLAHEVDTLNRERLALLSYLSPDKHHKLMGFTAQGLEQAAAEIKQLRLIASYHRRALSDRLRELVDPTQGPHLTVAGLALMCGESLLVLALFFVWRRLARAFFATQRTQLDQRHRRVRLTDAGRAERRLELLALLHGRASWLVLVLVSFALLPPGLRALRGIQLLDTTLTWVLGGALAVSVINALASRPRLAPSGGAAGALRLRSLRLVGGVVSVFGLTLTVCSRQLGHGTTYSWAIAGCWLSAAPLFLILVGWWREAVFRRLDAQARKTAVQRWLLHERRGYRSFLAAMVGAVWLFAGGVLRAVRRWLVGFDVTRRGLAYLFRRELGKLGGHAGAAAPLERLEETTYERFGPSTPSTQYLATELDSTLTRHAQAIREQRGGVVAVVSERGMGKTTALHRLQELTGDALSIELRVAPVQEVLGALCARFALPHGVSLAEATTGLDAPGAPAALLVDGAQHLVRPHTGGLKEFDLLLAAARAHSGRCTWVFAFDDAVWPLLKRARGVCPSFDEVIRIPPWPEAEIAELIQARSAALNLAPSFEKLLDQESAESDAYERQLALTERATSYYRLIWDYAGGNPGVALDIWRRALGVDERGRVFVQLFPSLTTTDLDHLPDPAAFVLRAVLQMAPATPREIERATLLTADEVGDALRYSLRRGFVIQLQDRYQVTWTWLRPISRFLQRKHLWVAA